MDSLLTPSIASASILFLLVVSAALIISQFTASSIPKGTRRPPGPPGKPIVGNIRDMAGTKPWLRFNELSKQYGPILRMRLAGREHIVLSTEKKANDLLRERGSIYSSRARLPAVAELLSDNLRPLFLPYCERWRNGRKFMHHVTNTNITNTYQPNQSLESITMLRDLIRDPARHEHWFHRYSAGIIYRLAFGKAVYTGDEQVVQDIENIITTIKRVTARGAYLVDTFPILMKLPKWIAPFKRELAAAHQIELDIFRGLMSDVRDEMERGEAPSSWQRDMIEQHEKFNLTDDEGAYVIGTLFEAGAGTTAVAMLTWVFSIVHNFEWLQKMQVEIDAVCGPDRLPVLEDMPQLPTVRAVLKEAMRWRPVFPGGIPHKSVKDDVYDGLFIPRGTIVHANNWAIHHDPELYPDPETFNPARWLDPAFPTYREPLTTFPNLHQFSAFGFGRRICPGQNIAERSLNLLTARVAWSCDISKAKDSDGRDITPPLYDYTSALVSQPLAFPFALKARDQKRVDLIEREFQKNAANDPVKQW